MHHRVGAPLARVEARVVLTRLLERTDAVLADPDVAPRRVNSLMVRRHDVLPLRLEAR
jgi:cytochrome P450